MPMKLFINAKFILTEHKGSFDDEETISLYLTQTLVEQFKSFLLKSSIKLKNNYYFLYMKRKKYLPKFTKR